MIGRRSEAFNASAKNPSMMILENEHFENGICVHQGSDMHLISGIGPCDTNRFNGTVEELKSAPFSYLL